MLDRVTQELNEQGYSVIDNIGKLTTPKSLNKILNEFNSCKDKVLSFPESSSLLTLIWVTFLIVDIPPPPGVWIL